MLAVMRTNKAKIHTNTDGCLLSASLPRFGLLVVGRRQGHGSPRGLWRRARLVPGMPSDDPRRGRERFTRGVLGPVDDPIPILPSLGQGAQGDEQFSSVVREEGFLSLGEVVERFKGRSHRPGGSIRGSRSDDPLLLDLPELEELR